MPEVGDLARAMPDLAQNQRLLVVADGLLYLTQAGVGDAEAPDGVALGTSLGIRAALDKSFLPVGWCIYGWV